jgi:SAM-dependent methyltransferase
MIGVLRSFYRRVTPVPARQWIVRHLRYPYSGKVDFGDLNRTKPISRVWGMDRGQPVDRYYIDRFLSQHSGEVGGHVLEVGANTYTLRYGGDKVQRSDVLHVAAGSPKATITADLTRGENLPADTFDCILCTQTLQFIFEIEEAVATLQRILKPGGVLLATVPGISQISRHDMDRWGDYWRLTSAACSRLFAKRFLPDHIQIHAYGNVLAATAFLQGVAVGDLRRQDLDDADPDYEVLLGVRAVKEDRGA